MLSFNVSQAPQPFTACYIQTFQPPAGSLTAPHPLFLFSTFYLLDVRLSFIAPLIAHLRFLPGRHQTDEPAAAAEEGAHHQ